MIDEKLMKVLECCANDDCGNCPTQVKHCRQHAMLNALDLIKRRDEEIEEQDQAIINALHHMKVVRAEAIKEFAGRLKTYPIDCNLPLLGLETKQEIEAYFNSVMKKIDNAIDNLVAEMTEETK